MDPQIILHELTIAKLGNRKRIIRVILPPGYDDSTHRYPVIYMHDGQNLLEESPFSGYSWDVARTRERLVRSGEIAPAIIVGIDLDPQRRILEYTPEVPPGMRKGLAKALQMETVTGEGFPYMDFVAHSVKPFIDEHYRTRSDASATAVAGSSCGGNISLLLGLAHPESFGVIGAFSPAYRFIRGTLKKQLVEANLKNMRIYLDMGAKENGLLSPVCVWQARHTHKQLLGQGLAPENSMCVIDKKGRHTELFWQDRFALFLKFFLGKNHR